MPHKRAHVVVPEELLAAIDSLVGPRCRSAFVTEVIEREVNRRRLLHLLNSSEPIWKDEDHPELGEGAEAWVRKMRDQDERLMQEKQGG